MDTPNRFTRRNKEKGQEKESMHALFTDYIRGRLDKMDDQIKQRCLESSSELLISSVFQGVSVYIDGYTEPSSDVLREIVVAGGGKSIHWFSKTSVTHVIATSLARTKWNQWGNGVKICKPEWIVESSKRGEQLPWKDFRLFPPEGDSSKPQIQTLHSAFQVTDGQSGKSVSPPKKAGDDGFISEFYGNSRLHHLSDWRIKLRNYVSYHQKENNQDKFPRLESLAHECEDMNLPEIVSTSVFKGEIIMHIDLDCFFVSVGLLSRPNLIGQPVVVTHSQGKGKTSKGDQQGSMSYSEIACCSYEARAMGLRNGMLLGHAQKLCPNLMHIPYEFNRYDDVSHKFYDVLLEYTNDIEPVSCDEAYVDLSVIIRKNRSINVDVLVTSIRQDIFKSTGCNCSAGIGSNRLISRLCTRKAKPNGQCIMINKTPDEVKNFIADNQVANLPGVGHVMVSKLLGNFGEHIQTCRDLQELNCKQLTSVFGPRTGQFLYDSCRGICSGGLKAAEARKSVSAEINYGMRFTDISQFKKFLNELVDEVVKRLNEASMKGQLLHLKLRLRSKDAPVETKKHLGHGVSDVFTKSCRLDMPCDSAPLILNACSKLLFGSSGVGVGEFGNFLVEDVRGMGVQLTKLVDASKPAGNDLKKAFAKQMGSLKRPSSTLSSTQAGNEVLKTPKSTTKPFSKNTSPPKSLKHQAKIRKAMLRPSLIGVSSLADVQNLIDEWIDASPQPEADDLETIVTYLLQVVDYGDLSHVYDVLRFISKKLGCSKNEHWSVAFRKVMLYSIEQKLKTEYGNGATLPSF